MEVILRDYAEKDFSDVVSVFRDSSDSLRKSNGGKHPDQAVDKLVAGTDRQVFAHFAGGARLIVAEVKGSGEVIGTGGIARKTLERLTGCAFSTAHYVRRAYQGGKAGVGVGSLLRRATIELARKEGCRRIYGYSTPEAIGFHGKFGAVFHPKNNLSYVDGIVPIHYYEIEVRKSALNHLPIEAGICRLRQMRQWSVVMWGLIFGFGRQRSLLYPLKSLYSWLEVSVAMMGERRKDSKASGQSDSHD